MLPNDHKLPMKYYDVKKLISNLNMGYQKIDACVNDCMLFYKEDSEKNIVTYVMKVVTRLRKIIRKS